MKIDTKNWKEDLIDIVSSETEKDFMKAIAEMLDDTFKFKKLAEMVDKLGFRFALSHVDKFLDEKFGPTWFDKIKPTLRNIAEVLKNEDQSVLEK